MRTMLKVVAHCHDFYVIHRDLKPENFLLADKSPDARLKAIDFGLSVFYKEGRSGLGNVSHGIDRGVCIAGQTLRQIVGSAYYVAPEVLRKKYGKEADIWSCGVILYILLSGYPPFYGETESAIFDSILKVCLWNALHERTNEHFVTRENTIWTPIHGRMSRMLLRIV